MNCVCTVTLSKCQELAGVVSLTVFQNIDLLTAFIRPIISDVSSGKVHAMGPGLTAYEQLVDSK